MCTYTHTCTFTPHTTQTPTHIYKPGDLGAYFHFKTAVVNNSKQISVIYITEKEVTFLMCKELLQASEANI